MKSIEHSVNSQNKECLHHQSSQSDKETREQQQQPHRWKGLDHPDLTTELYHRLQKGPIKGIYKYLTPTVVSLAGGLPMTSVFPFTTVSVQVKTYDDGKDQFTLQNPEDLKLNYHTGDGIPAMKEWILDHVKTVHHPPAAFDVCATVGSTDALHKVMRLIKTDYVLFDQYAFAEASNTCYLNEKRVAGVAVDSFGMIPSALKESVSTIRAAGHTVNAVYLCPIGQNPMGFTITETRKQEIYQVCQELDLIIVEDGKVFFLFVNSYLFTSFSWD
jgi:2-aminoadipate transaminase